MIWLIFKNCSRNKSKSVKSTDIINVNNSKQIIQELLREFDAIDDLSECDNTIFSTELHFNYLSVVEPFYNEEESIPKMEMNGHQNVFENNTVFEMADLENDIDAATMIINRRCNKVTEKHLKLLQCPFTWNLESGVWKTNIIDHIKNKYGKYNMNISSITFSLEKYISNLMISCGLFKTNQVDKAHDKLKDIWEWLDKLDNENERFYQDIRDGLKHIIMSTLCHVLYAVNKTLCWQLYNTITRFNSMNVKSRAAVHAINAAVYIEIGGKTLLNVVQYAKKACDLDSETAQWKFIYSLALTAQRQYLMSNKSCPTASEFDAIQHAIILSNRPNPNFDFHRMRLMTNKILYHYHFDKSKIKTNTPEKTKQDFYNIIELIKSIVIMEPEDPHLIVKCAKALITLPYLPHENILLIKQMISIAVNVSFNDPTVIRAIKEIIDIFRELIDTYKQLNENKIYLDNTKIQNDVKNKEDDDLENDLKLIAEKYEIGSRPILDLINLLEKYDGRYRWKIMAQICSYSILFKDSDNLLVGVEQFMMLIDDKNIANSNIVTDHRSIFIKDDSKVFNLAELMCNEIKLAIILGHSKNQDETKFYLDQLTNIMEVCQVKSKAVNPSLIVELTGSQKKQKEQNIQCPKNQKQKKVFQKMNKQHGSHKNKKFTTNNYKYTSSNQKRAIKSKTRKINQHKTL
uniref:Uncharacterized protein n=1 Tax=Sipha flava TaxID=143950 RepID=A0A2S2RB26_9HEMI